ASAAASARPPADLVSLAGRNRGSARARKALEHRAAGIRPARRRVLRREGSSRPVHPLQQSRDALVACPFIDDSNGNAREPSFGEAAFAKVTDVAYALGSVLAGIGLRALVKTSGKTG